jgi:hypothetical protein
MSGEWYYAQNKQRVGPVSIAELCRLAARSQLLPSDMVMNSRTGKWMPAREIKGLFPHASGPIQPPVPEAEPATIRFRCQACRADLTEPAEKVGAFVPCRFCGVYVQIPASPTPPSDPRV